MGDHLWPCSRGGGCPDQQMRPHTHTLGGTDGSGGERQRWPRPSCVSCPDTASLSANAPAAAPCSSPPVGPPSGTASPRCCCVSLPPVGKEQRQLHSQGPCPDSTRAVTAGVASGPYFVRTTGPGFAGGTPACLLTQPAWLCV